MAVSSSRPRPTTCSASSPAEAVAAAREIVRLLGSVNLLLPEDCRLHASIAIGYGRILNIDEDDLYGDEVNLASKLGEDIAGRGAILLTEAAKAQTNAAGNRHPRGDGQRFRPHPHLPRPRLTPEAARNRPPGRNFHQP